MSQPGSYYQSQHGDLDCPLFIMNLESILLEETHSENYF